MGVRFELALMWICFGVDVRGIGDDLIGVALG